MTFLRLSYKGGKKKTGPPSDKEIAAAKKKDFGQKYGAAEKIVATLGKAMAFNFVIPGDVTNDLATAKQKGEAGVPDYDGAIGLLDALLDTTLPPLTQSAKDCITFAAAHKKAQAAQGELGKSDRTIAGVDHYFATPVTVMINLSGQARPDWGKMAKAYEKLDEKIENQKENIKKAETFEKAYETALGYCIQLAGQERDGIHFDQPIRDRLDQAKQKTDSFTPDWTGATSLLTDVGKVFKEIETNAKKHREGEIEATRHKPIYELLVQQITTARDQASLLSGAESIVTSTNEALKAAKDDADHGEYEEACKKLDKLDPLAKAEELSKKAKKNAGNSDFRTALTTVEENLQKLEAVAGVESMESIREHKAEIKRLVDSVKDSKVTQVIATATNSMNLLAGTIENDEKIAQNMKKYADRLYKETDKLILETRACVPVADLSELLANVREAEAMLNSSRPSAAVKAFNALRVNLDTAHDAGQLQKTRYEDLEKRFVTQVEPAIKLGQGNTVVTIQSLANRLVTLRATTVAPAAVRCDFKAAADALENVFKTTNGDNLHTLQTLLDNSTEIVGVRRACDREVNEKRDLVIELMNRFESMHADTEPFKVDLNTVMSEWNDAKQTALSADALEQALKSFNFDIDQIINAGKHMLDPQNALVLNNSQDLAAKKKKWTQFAAARDDAKKAIRAIAIEDPDAVQLHQGALDRLLNGVNSQDEFVTVAKPDELIQKIKLLTTKIGEVAKKRKETADKDRVEALELAEEIEKTINEKKSDLGWFSRFKPYFKDHAAHLAEVREMLKSPLPGVVKAGADELARMNKVLNAIGTTGPEFSDATAKLHEVQQKLKNANLVKATPNQAKLLTTRLTKGVEPELKTGVSPEAAINKLIELETAVDAAILAADKAMDQREEIANLIKELKPKVEKLENAPALLKDLKGRIEAAGHVGEGDETRLLAGLKSAQGVLELAAANTEFVVEFERTSREKEIRGDKLKARYEAELDLFERVEQAQADKVHKDTPKEDMEEGFYKQIGTAVSDAKKFAKASNYQAAIERLTAARGFARGFAENPMGTRISARGAFKKVLDRYQGDAIDLIKQIHEIAVKVVDDAKLDGTQPVITSANKASEVLKKAASLIDPGFFDDILKDLEKAREENRTADARLHKEDGIRRVKVLQTRLTGDFVLKALAGNPFKNPATSPTGLLAALRDLEANFRRA